MYQTFKLVDLGHGSQHPAVKQPRAIRHPNEETTFKTGVQSLYGPKVVFPPQPWKSPVSRLKIVEHPTRDGIIRCVLQDHEAQMTELRRELRSYAKLEDNWDGEGAKAISDRAVGDALKFLANIPSEIPIPYPEECTSGDVGVYWDYQKKTVFAEVLFSGDGTFAYFAVLGTPHNIEKEYGKDGVDVNASWPEDLVRLLNCMKVD